MWKFIKDLSLFLILPSTLIAYALLSDPFKVWFPYDDYYENPNAILNRGWVCLKIYDKNKGSENFDSFILGSSRSIAFKTDKWSEYLSEGSRAFHFDASAEGIYGISNKLKYLVTQGSKVDNALVILDLATLRKNVDWHGHLFISPPALSENRDFVFYTVFLRASLDIGFLFAFTDYSIFRTHRRYMKWIIPRLVPKGDMITGDLWYLSYDEQIAKDSVAYYSSMLTKGLFYERVSNQVSVSSKREVGKKELEQLQEIKEIFRRQGTDYRIVISPLYDQIPLDEERIKVLTDLFGNENVFNYSGVNEFTEEIGNYYESSHYRPHVADRIMEDMYD